MNVIRSGLPTDGWTQPMLNPRDCIHGSLARKCEICERDHEIHVLTDQLRGAVEDLREAIQMLQDARPAFTDPALNRRWGARRKALANKWGRDLVQDRDA